MPALKLMTIIGTAEDCPPQKEDALRWQGLATKWTTEVKRMKHEGKSYEEIKKEGKVFLHNKLNSSTDHFPGASAASMKEQKKHFAEKKNHPFPHWNTTFLLDGS